ncbi:MarR family winged helix-turn-helix transcriptional regulator [Hylemonella sp. W303a]|uniref:MarR family winged helix-turn-helix transcriptional regulator n=1 Tax=Hylemonella sp. W303a TaxID=3389873 RepID=UPI00396B28CF
MHLHRARQLRGLTDGPSELTHMEGKALGYIARHPGTTQSELVTRSRRDKAQIARLIGSLRERGLLETRVDELDRRSQRLHLTSAGQQLYEAQQLQWRKLARLGMAGLSAEESRQLVVLLQKVEQGLSANPDEV